MRRLPLGFLLAGALFAAPLHAQKPQWDNLAQIKPGNKVQVVEQSLKSTTGKFVRYSETDLTLTSDGKEVVISKQQVYRVSILGKNRKRNTLIGLGIGTGAGMGMGFGLMEHETGYGGAVAGSILGCAVVGAGIGAMMPSTKEIYRGEAVHRTTTSAVSPPAQNRSGEDKRDESGARPHRAPHGEPPH